MSDYYSILGVLNSASADDIRKAYHLKAKLFHPDIYKGSDGDQSFKLLNEAYRTLINPARRHQYDLRLKYGEGAAGMSQAQKDRMRRYSINYEMLRRRREAERRMNESLRKRFRMFDRFIFWSLLGIGLAGLAFSLMDLVMNRRYIGILFFIVILACLVYAYRTLGRKKQ